MPSIQIVRKHHKTIAQARAAVDKVARSLAEKFDVEHEWRGNTLAFTRMGVSGRIALTKGAVEVLADLSFLLGAIKPAIEREIEKYLEREFGSS
jgi:putative polyhydroxyalkanoate system protein